MKRELLMALAAIGLLGFGTRAALSAEPTTRPTDFNTRVKALRVDLGPLLGTTLNEKRTALLLREATAFSNFAAALSVDELGRAVIGGEGVDIRELESDKGRAWPAVTLPAPTTRAAVQSAEYFEDARSLAESVGGGTDFAASLVVKSFSIAPSFKSSNLRQNSESETSGYFVVKWDVDYDWQEVPNTTMDHFTAEARGLLGTPAADLTPDAMEKFYARYGTHFVSQVKPRATYLAIYTFHASSRESLKSFSSAAGLSVGVPGVFNVDFSQKVKTALTNSNNQVSFTFKEYITGAGGLQPLPEASPTQPTDFLTFDVLVARHNRYLDASGNLTNRALMQVKLTPFANLIKPAVSNQIPQKTLEYAVTVLQSLNDLQDDLARVFQSRAVWNNPPDTSASLKLANASDAIREAVVCVLSDPSSDNKKTLTTAVTEARQISDALFGPTADFFPAVTQVQVVQPAPTTPPASSLNGFKIRFKVDIKIEVPAARLVGVKDVGVQDLPVNEVPGAATAKFRVFETGAVTLTPIPQTNVILQVADIAGRTNEAVLVSAGDPAALLLPVSTGDPATEKWLPVH